MPKIRSVRARSQTSESNGESRAAASTRRGTRASGMQVGATLGGQPSTCDRNEQVGLDQLGQPGPGRREPEPEVVGQVAVGGHAEGAGARQQELALGFLLVGCGPGQDSAGMTRSGRSYRRSNVGRRPAVVTRPAMNRYSMASLPSRQPHQGPPFSPPSSSSLAASGPRSATCWWTASTYSANRPSRRLAPQTSAPLRSIRQRSSGCRSIGTNDATWPQYSYIRRWRSMCCWSSGREYGPRREKKGSSCERVNTLIESICTTLSRSMTRARWRRVTGPVGRGSTKPWAASAARRAWAAVIRISAGCDELTFGTLAR